MITHSSHRRGDQHFVTTILSEVQSSNSAALVTLTLWTLVTFCLAFYPGRHTTFGSVYGPLTALMALLLWYLGLGRRPG